MVIKITPPDDIKEAITIEPRSHDKVIIAECFNGFGIPTDVGLYGISMRDGGIEVLLTPRGKTEAIFMFSVHHKDEVIAAIEDWVVTHPDEAAQPLKATLSDRRFCNSDNHEAQETKTWWSAKDILEEIKNNTERGRQEYRKLIQLTIDLLTRGRIQ